MTHKQTPDEPTETPDDDTSAAEWLPPPPERSPDSEYVRTAAAAVAAAAIQVDNPWLKASLFEQSAEVWRNYALASGVPPLRIADADFAAAAEDGE